MHMADALLSPAVGATMWVASAGMIAFSSNKVSNELDDRKIPLMGVLGAFLFAVQMINFTIPATGSSGHLGGGVLLAILLGPYAAFLTIASVLTVQALFFADGGLLALGCNIWNLGVFPALIAYPLIYRKKVGNQPDKRTIVIAAIIASVAGMQLGALGVVLETTASGVSSLPFFTFAALMQPIHLAIGIVEGLVTATVVSFLHTARPEIIQCAIQPGSVGNFKARNMLVAFFIATMLIGGIVSWFASERPDGLEWSITKVTGKKELETAKPGIYGILAKLQKTTAFLPDYNFRKTETGEEAAREENNRRGTSISGILGGIITLVIVFVIGLMLKSLKLKRLP